MRTICLMVMVVGLSASAYAQTTDTVPPSCFPTAAKGPVVVKQEDGTSFTGTLVCMSQNEVLMAGTGLLQLDSIREISRPRDGIFDGVLKGAAVGLVILAFCGGECDSDTLLRGTLAYATIGGLIDAVQGNGQMIYRKSVSPTLTWKLRF